MDFLNILKDYGLPGGIIFLLYITMKYSNAKDLKQLEQNNEKEKQAIQVDIMRVESHKDDIDKLCSKIDIMVDTIHDLQVKDTQKTVRLENGLDEVKDMYIRIAKKTDNMEEKIVEIRTLVNQCPKIIEEEKRWSISPKKNLELKTLMQ